MLLRKIIEQPVSRVLEKDDIWQMVDELYLNNCSSEKYDLKRNTEIKLNVIMDEWDKREGYFDNHVQVYIITFEGKVIGVGGILGDSECTFKHDIHFIDSIGYLDMIAYLSRLYIQTEINVVIQDLDFDFKL